MVGVVVAVLDSGAQRLSSPFRNTRRPSTAIPSAAGFLGDPEIVIARVFSGIGEELSTPSTGETEQDLITGCSESVFAQLVRITPACSYDENMIVA